MRKTNAALDDVGIGVLRYLAGENGAYVSKILIEEELKKAGKRENLSAKLDAMENSAPKLLETKIAKSTKEKLYRLSEHGRKVLLSL